MGKTRTDVELENEKRKMMQDQLITELRKEKFIEEIKSGLGETIKNEPNKTQKPPSLFKKLLKIFT